MEKTIINWEFNIPPEQTDVKISHAFGYDFVPVVLIGRYFHHSSLFASISMRIKRQITGYEFIDMNDNILETPVDGQWHWHTNMSEIVAWGALPSEDDPRWIFCTDQLPEDKFFDLEHEMSLLYQGVSVMTLCETSCRSEVRFANRFRKIKTDNINSDYTATHEWVWSKNVDDVKAWMPYPAMPPNLWSEREEKVLWRRNEAK